MQTNSLKRTSVLLCAAAVLFANLLALAAQKNAAFAYPWSAAELLEPAILANMLRGSSPAPPVICVAFPSLYKQRHILHSRYAGPGNSPEGIKALTEAVQALSKDSEVVIYCGCCPMVRCPNLAPSYRKLKELGFTRVRVLNLPTTLLADWTSKGYPVE